jgi:predicted nuclease of predicted toxin-antitoxin system
MRVLIDECTPTRLRLHLPGHDVYTVRYMGWAGKKNGELLSLMTANGFTVLLTVDQSVRHQQNLTTAGVAVVVLIGPSNKYSDLLPLMPAACAALAAIRPGDVIEIR